MEYSGFLARFRTKRLLTPQECAEKLKQEQRLDVGTHYQLSVITMNATVAGDMLGRPVALFED